VEDPHSESYCKIKKEDPKTSTPPSCRLQPCVQDPTTFRITGPQPRKYQHLWNPSNTIHIFLISECHSEHHCKKPSHLCNLRKPVRVPLQKTFTTFVVSKHHSNLCNLIAPLQVLSGPCNHQQQRNYPHLQSMSSKALHNFLQSQSSHHSFWVLIFIQSLFPCHRGVESLITW
jgi:hypothetical protein